MSPTVRIWVNIKVGVETQRFGFKAKILIRSAYFDTLLYWMLSASFSAGSEAILARFRPRVCKRTELDGELGPPVLT